MMRKAASGLKPCPFCGWENASIFSRYTTTRIRYIGDYRLVAEARRYYVRCNRCYAHGGTTTGFIATSFVNSFPFGKGLEELKDEAGSGEPELPSFVKTKEQLEERAAELWNMRKCGGCSHEDL